MPTIIESPPALLLQGMPVKFRLASSHGSPENPSRIMCEPVPDFFEVLTRNESNIATFDIREYFKKLLSVSLNYNDAALHTDACKKFNISFYDYGGNPPEAVNPVAVSRDVLMGDVPAWMHHRIDYVNFDLAARLATNPFMSWWPADKAKKVLPDQPEMVYFFASEAGTIDLKVYITFTDGTGADFTADSLTLAANQVGSFPAGYNKLDLASVNTDKKVESYQIRLNSNGPQRNYVVDYKPYRYTRYIFFRTSLAGWEVVACTGEADDKADLKRQTANRIYDVNASGRLHKSDFARESEHKVKVNTGYVPPWHMTWLNDLFETEEAYELLDAVLTPIRITNKSFDSSYRSEQPSSAEIEYERLQFAR